MIYRTEQVVCGVASFCLLTPPPPPHPPPLPHGQHHIWHVSNRFSTSLNIHSAPVNMPFEVTLGSSSSSQLDGVPGNVPVVPHTILYAQTKHSSHSSKKAASNLLHELYTTSKGQMAFTDGLCTLFYQQTLYMSLFSPTAAW